MFIWKLWGDVWQVGDGEDYLIHLVFQLFVSVFLVVLTIAVILVVFPALYLYKAVKGSDESRYAAQLVTVAELSKKADPASTRGCPHCGNTRALDIRPCVSCGRDL